METDWSIDSLWLGLMALWPEQVQALLAVIFLLKKQVTLLLKRLSLALAS